MTEVPIQPVDKPILCNPYVEPADHWHYDKLTGAAKRAGFRRPAGYWYKTDRVGGAQQQLFDEERDDLILVNRLRNDVRRWRESGYRGASNVTRELLHHWTREDRWRRLFFCQREAVETIIWLAEIALPGRWTRSGFQKFEVGPDDLTKLLHGEKPAWDLSQTTVYPTLIDPPGDESLLSLVRLGCKMATGSGKTVVMAMLIAWAFCNRGRNPASREFPNAVLICCPNLTVKERLQVLRTDLPNNYYEQFDIVPTQLRPLIQSGKVMVENWHSLASESEHKEGDRSFAVVNKGEETPEAFAKRVLGDMADRLPIMVLNDEGHHCWRPAAAEENLIGEVEGVTDEVDDDEAEEARVWLSALDRINNCRGDGKPGIGLCVDLSATPFYLKGSGHVEGRPFPWIVSDFGLVDAIESGIVKIPRLPVLDTTGRPDPKYFKLWEAIRQNLQPGERLPGRRAGKPKPDVVWRESEGALTQIAGQWVERFKVMREARPGQEHVPPVLIVVCDNTDIAKLFYEKISGEREVEVVTQADVEEVLEEEVEEQPVRRRKRGKQAKPKTRTVYESGAVEPEYFSNREGEPKRTIRIDTKLLAEAESEDPKKTKSDLAEQLRRVVATVGKPGEPGEHVRCVVSVAMLTEGWDANNVTNILGIRAFGSQLLCEQVVGRGLRRMDYTPDPATGMLTEEYVDVYGIPFSVIPFKGRAVTAAADDKPKQHVRALPERAGMEMRFPVVEGYVFALRRNLIKCDVDAMDGLVLEPDQEPTATFVLPTLGYQEGFRSRVSAPIQFTEHNREDYYRQTHAQAIQFQITRMIVEQFVGTDQNGSDAKGKVLKLQSRHQLFPQVYRYVREYVERKVDFQGCHPCELGLERYFKRIVGQLRDGIMPDDEEGEPPLLPVLNRYKAIGTTAEVDFKTVRPCWPTNHSHVDQVVADTATWEQGAAFRLEQCAMRGIVLHYARNDHLGFVILYEYQGISHHYEPDYMVRLRDGRTVVLEVKGHEDNQDRAKHEAARRWVAAVNNWKQLGRWGFHVCRNPQTLMKELEQIAEGP